MDFVTAIDLDCLSWSKEAPAKAKEHVKRKWAENDRIMRELLSQWVSEFEPSVGVDHRGEIIGLCRADDPSGTLVIRR